MARICKFTELKGVPARRNHSDVECGYRLISHSGGTLLQLDTYGSNDRQILGKTSQSIQFDELGAAKLIGIILTAFPKLRSERIQLDEER